jgi:hypothetical protein
MVDGTSRLRAPIGNRNDIPAGLIRHFKEAVDHRAIAALPQQIGADPAREIGTARQLRHEAMRLMEERGKEDARARRQVTSGEGMAAVEMCARPAT